MDAVPEEVLLLIFSHLSAKDLLRCSEVNSQWNRLSHDNCLWDVVDFSSTNIPVRTLAKVLRKGCKSLVLQKATVVDPPSWSRLFLSNQLVSLDLSKAEISRRSLGQLLRSCTALVSLNLQGCGINHIAYKAIAANPNLKLLNLSCCKKLPAQTYKTIFSSCLKLEDVNLSCHDNLFSVVTDIESSSLRRLVVANSELEYLDVKAIIKQCPNLNFLDMSENFIGPIGESKIKTFLANTVEIQNYQKIDFEEDEEDYLSDLDWDNDDAESEMNAD